MTKTLIFTKTCFRDFLNELSKHISIYIINTNLSNYFKYKYINEHENDECRLLPCNDVNFNFIKLNTQFFINLIVYAYIILKDMKMQIYIWKMRKLKKKQKKI